MKRGGEKAGKDRSLLRQAKQDGKAFLKNEGIKLPPKTDVSISERRIAVGQILQETNTFSPIPTTLETFKRYYVHKGEEVLTGFGNERMEIPGILSVLRSSNVQVVPLIAGGPDDENPGYVKRPVVDLSVEMTNILIAQRSYQANLSVMDRMRDAYKAALSIGAR